MSYFVLNIFRTKIFSPLTVCQTSCAPQIMKNARVYINPFFVCYTYAHRCRFHTARDVFSLNFHQVINSALLSVSSLPYRPEINHCFHLLCDGCVVRVIVPLFFFTPLLFKLQTEKYIILHSSGKKKLFTKPTTVSVCVCV